MFIKFDTPFPRNQSTSLNRSLTPCRWQRYNLIPKKTQKKKHRASSIFFKDSDRTCMRLDQAVRNSIMALACGCALIFESSRYTPFRTLSGISGACGASHRQPAKLHLTGCRGVAGQ